MNIIDKLFRRSKIKIEMLNNDNYIKWLEMFTEKFPVFDNEFIELLLEEELSEKDINNIEIFDIFIEILLKYIKDNKITLKKVKDYIKFCIKHNDNYFEIGIVNEYKFYCKRLSQINDLEYIDCNDVFGENCVIKK